MADSTRVHDTSHLPVAAPRAKQGAGIAYSFATIQRQLEANWGEPLEMPRYSPVMANRAAANLLGTAPSPGIGMGATGGAERTTVQRACAECEAEQQADEETSEIQTKLAIGQPGDKYEQEADRVAQQVVNTLHAPQSQTTSSASLSVVQPQSLPGQPAIADITLMRQGTGTAAEASEGVEERIQRSRGQGQPLGESVRAPMEQAFGADFSGVRVHTDGESHELNQAVQAKAFTTGQDIYFRGGAYEPGSRGGQELLAHELTHVVQQNGGTLQRNSVASTQAVSSKAEQNTSKPYTGGGLSNPSFLWRMVQTKLALGSEKQSDTCTKESEIEGQQQDFESVASLNSLDSLSSAQPDIQAKCSECAVEDNIQRQAISSVSSEDGTIQALGFEDIGNAASSAASWAGDQASGAAEWAGDRIDDVAEIGADAFASIVERVSPDLAALIRNGPEGLLEDTLGEGIQEWIQGILGDIDISSAITELQASLGTAFSAIQGVMSGDAASCEAFAQGINSLKELAQSFMDNPAVQAIQEAFTTISSAFQTVTDFIVAPVFDTLMEVAGGVFNQVKVLAGMIWKWGGTVRDYLSEAWDWVLEQLGIGGDGEGGIWEWIKGQASAVWNQIKETFAPVIGPLRTVLTVMVAFSPAGPIIAAVTYGPQIVEAVQWLWNNKDNPDIVQAAHEQMGDTILPQLLSGAQSFSETLQSTATTLISQVVQISEGILQLLGSVSGAPLLSMAQGMVQTISTGMQSFATWCQESFQGAVDSVQSLLVTIQEVVTPYAEVLSSLALAVVSPGMIPVILVGWAWRAIPDCYKPPIIGFLLDAIIGILQALPELPMMGPLWPMLKSGVLGFLEGVKGQDDETKIAITNKLAKIISGASPAFLFGFVKGLLQGIWEGITDPFVLIYTAIQGLGNLVQWLNSTADSALQNESDTASANSVPSEQTPPDTATQMAGSEPSAARGVTGGTIPAAEQQAIGQRMREMGSELEPPATQVTEGFMPAVEEAFSGGEGVSYEQLMQKLGEAWEAVQNAIRGAGQELANSVCEFLLQDSAEGAMGEAVGWLTGTIVFEVILGILTAATYQPVSAAGRLLQQFARVLDWTGELMGAAFRALSRIGGYVMDAVRGLGRLLSNAGGAVRVVMDAIREIGEKLMRFADELLGRVGRGATGEAAEAGVGRAGRSTGLADDAVEAGASRTTITTPRGTTSDVNIPGANQRPDIPETHPRSSGGVEPEAPASRNTDGTADISNTTPESPSARDSSIRDSGHIESNQLSDRQIRNELDEIGSNPNLIEGTPPNRRAKIGEHEWHEQPNGSWCRHSNGQVCVPPNDADLAAIREKHGLSERPTLGAGRTDISGLEDETFEGLSPSLRKEAGLPSLDETMPDREIQSPFTNPAFTRHAEEDIFNQVNQKINTLGLTPSDLEGKTLFVHIDNPLGVCNKCTSGLMDAEGAMTGVVKQFSDLHPTLTIQITAQGGVAFRRSVERGGDVTTLVVKAGQIVE